MIASLLGAVGVDLKREVKNLSLTLVLALLGAFLAVVALAIGMRALYLWLEIRYGVFPAMGILGGASALLAVAAFCAAFMRQNAKPRIAPQNPIRATAAALAEASEQAMGSATGSIRYGSRKQVYSTILIAALAGLLAGRKL